MNTFAIHKQEYRDFIVTALSPERDSDSKPLWSHLWHANRPMGLGFPFRWVLEKTKTGIRIRNIDGDLGSTLTHSIRELNFSELETAKPIELDPVANLRLLIQPVRSLQQIAERNTSWHPKVIPMESRKRDDFAYRWIFTAVAALSLLFIARALVQPVPEQAPTELIPAQYAKVILNSHKKIQPLKNNTENTTVKNQNNVVQAFKSSSVKKSSQILFNSGAARALLSKSKLIDGAGSKAGVNRVFGNSSVLPGKLNQIASNNLDLKTSKVGIVGGKTGPGELGYSSGSGGTVTGQGKGLFSLTGQGKAAEEGLTRDEVGRVIRKHIKEVRYCYESAMQRHPGLEGKVVVSFTIRANGSVKSASTKETSGDTGLDNCITSHLLKWAFPKPRGGTEVAVSYPFIFKSLSN